MGRKGFLANLLLRPASFFYGVAVGIRNWMFNRGIILKEHTFDIPVVVVGNIAVGGTGKTPHTEYLVESLRNHFKIGVLSRGYRRRTKGFLLAGSNTSVEDLGDEPLQIYRKYGHDVTVAVCEDRVKGIEEMRRLVPDLNLILLDDAFQHRYVKPSVSVVLTDYGRPIQEDSLLPFGRLREPMSSMNRADIVIVTKCPPDVRPMDLRLVRQHLNLYPYQKLFFSGFSYGQPMALFPEVGATMPPLDQLQTTDNVLSLTGIENPRPFLRYLRRFPAKVKVLRFPDHHSFTGSDLQIVKKRFEALKGVEKYILTTEKDAMRLKGNPHFPHSLKRYIFYIPIKVHFIESSDNGDFGLTVRQLLRNKI